MIISKTQEWIVEEIGPGATDLSDVTIAWMGRFKVSFQKFREKSVRI